VARELHHGQVRGCIAPLVNGMMQCQAHGTGRAVLARAPSLHASASGVRHGQALLCPCPQNAGAPSWTSLTPGIVTVDAAGRVVSVATGLGLVQASVGRKADTAEVLVRQIPAFLNVTPDTLHFIFSDEAQTLTAALADANRFPIPGRPAVTWSSDDPLVATADTGGVVTATLGTGFTWIRAVFQALADSAFVNTPATPFP
jgi:hypothetical protein